MFRPTTGLLKNLTALAAAIIIIMALSSCSAYNANQSAQKSFMEARAAHAQQLAPYEYYSAKAYLKEGKNQLEQSDFAAARKFSNQAKTRATEALAISKAKQAKPMIPYMEGLKYRGEGLPAPVIETPTPAAASTATPPAATPSPPAPVQEVIPIVEDEDEDEEAAVPPAPVAEQPPAEEAATPAPPAEPEPVVEEEEDKDSIDERIRQLLLEDDDDDEGREE